MSHQDNRKRCHRTISDDDSLLSQLQALLHPLAGGDEPLKLSILAGSVSLDEKMLSHTQLTQAQEAALEQARKDQLSLFETHIGPYEEVVGSAETHVEIMIVENRIHSDSERYEHPSCRVLKGPKPDPCVWQGLFLGRDAEMKARKQLEQDREDGKTLYTNIKRDLQQKVRHLSVLELARNILRYLAQEACDLDHDSTRMLRFCAVYGLSGAISNVLAGKYAGVTTTSTMTATKDDLTIDTPLVVKDTKSDDDKEETFLAGDLCQPVIGIAAALGYCHVVRHAIQSLKADVNATTFLKSFSTGEAIRPTPIGSEMILWAITKNQPEMLKCLVESCGFQFRWIANPKDMQTLYNILFHIDQQRDEWGVVWRSKTYNEHEYMFDRHAQRRYRAKRCYHEKQKMLKVMIELGFPRELLIPKMDVSLDANLLEKAKAKGLDEPDRKMGKEFYRSLSRAERKARDQIYDACEEFNAVSKSKDRLDLVDFYRHVLDMWKDQSSVQEARLPEFEKLDPRWQKLCEKGEEAFAPWWEMKSEYSDDEEDEEPMDIYEMEQATGLKLVHSFSSDEDGLESPNEE